MVFYSFSLHGFLLRALVIDSTPENRLLRTKSVSTGFFHVLYLSFLPNTDAPVLLIRPAPDSYMFDAFLEYNNNVPLRLLVGRSNLV